MQKSYMPKSVLQKNVLEKKSKWRAPIKLCPIGKSTTQKFRVLLLSLYVPDLSL